MTRISEPIYEYACHEGNYGMPNILKAQRAVEAQERDRPQRARALAQCGAARPDQPVHVARLARVQHEIARTTVRWLSIGCPQTGHGRTRSPGR